MNMDHEERLKEAETILSGFMDAYEKADYLIVPELAVACGFRYQAECYFLRHGVDKPVDVPDFEVFLSGKLRAALVKIQELESNQSAQSAVEGGLNVD